MKAITLGRSGFSAIVDDEDYDNLIQYRWSLVKGKRTLYASTTINKKIIYMHRLILGAPKGIDVDHIRRYGLDNRRSNLRLATTRQNIANGSKHIDNKTGFKGVSRDKRRTGYYATIGVNSKTLFLGYFQNPVDAAMAYNDAATRHFGEFAKLNDIPNQQGTHSEG